MRFLGRSIAWIKTNWLYTVLLLFLCSIYVVLRLVSIRNLPMFVDEAIYVRWAQAGLHNPDLRLTSLSDGKQPLFIWLVTFAMGYIPNPITAGRLVSIFTGFLTGVGLFLLAYELFKNKWVSILTVTFFACLPFSLAFNRMALYESTSGMFLVWSLLLGILLTKNLQLHYSLTLALFLGGGILTKTTGFLSIYLLPVLLFLLPISKSNRISRLFTWTSLVVVAIGASLLYYSVLHLSSQFYQVNEKNAIFVYHIEELIQYDAFLNWIPHLATLANWIMLYTSIPTAIFFIASLFFLTSQWKQKMILLLWFIIPFIGYGLFGRQLNARYLYPIFLPLLPLFSANILDAYKHTKIKKLIILPIFICIFSMFFVDYRIVFSLASSPIPKEDLSQYINGPSAGGGIKQSVAYLSQKAQEGPIYIATEGIYGSLPTTAMELYFLDYPSVQKSGFEVSGRVPKLLAEKTHEMPVYIVFNQTQNPPNWPMGKISEYKKGISDSYLRLYRLQKIPLSLCKSYLQKDAKTYVDECEYPSISSSK
ncbi:MAG: glycosyltransferase family 39 protein [Patescibacteria group bacterium]